MTAEQLKIKVKEAFIQVSSEEFLNIKIKEKVHQLEHEFLRWKTSNPNCSLNDFKQWEVQAINMQTTNSAEIMAIGIYLLALDNLKI